MKSKKINPGAFVTSFNVFWEKHPYFCFLFLVFAIGELLLLAYNIVIDNQMVTKSLILFLIELLTTAIILVIVLKLMRLWSPEQKKKDDAVND